MANDYPLFTYEKKKPGDPIRSSDWNAAMQAIADLGRALRTKTNGAPTGPLTLQGPLTIQGMINATGFVGDGSRLTGLQTPGSSQWTSVTNGAIYYSGGNVGIGALQPNEKLEVDGTVKATRFVGDGSGLTGLPTTSNPLLASAPANPQRIGQWTIQQGPVNGVYVAGKYAYLAVDGIGLAIVDISDPATPRQVGEGGYRSLYTRSVQVAGRYAYLATSRMGLDIYDIANAAIPGQVGAVSIQATTQDIYVSGPYAYLATDDNGLQVIDISNPAAPQAIGQGAPAIGAAQGVYVVGAYAYVATSDQGLQIVNISDPANPQPIGVGLNDIGSAQGVYVVGQYAYVATSNQGLQIVDISDPAAPQRIGQGATAIGSAQGVYVAGDYAYVATSDKGLQIVNIAQPIDPKLQSISNIGAAQAVFVAGRYAYIAAGAAGLQIIDIQGTAIFAASIGAVAANVLSVSENATVDNNLYVRSGLNVGPGGIKSDGTVTAMRFVGDGSGLTGLPVGSGGSPWVNKADGTNGIYYSAGPVSIGATNKGATLQILNRNQDANGDTLILGRTDGSHVRLGYHTEYGWLQSGGSKPLFINPLDGNVGIGTTQASEKLEVNGTVKATRFVGDGSGLTGLPATGSANLMKIDGNNTLEFGADVSGKQVDAGKIGYQTFTPDALDIVGAGTTGANRKIKLWAEGGATIAGGLTISGNVGIGTTTPRGFQVVLPESSKEGVAPGPGVTIAGGRDGNASIELRNNGSGTPHIDFAQAGAASDYDARIRLTAPGQLAIEGANVRVYGNLYVDGTLAYYWGPDSRWKHIENRAGDLAGSFNDPGPPSDIRFKTALRPLRNALEKVMQLHGIYYRWGETGLKHFTRNIASMLSAGPDATEAEDQQLWEAERQKAYAALSGEKIGLVAQDVEPVVPEVVHTDKEGYKYIHYQQLTALLVEAIKEQNALIQALSVKVAALGEV